MSGAVAIRSKTELCSIMTFSLQSQRGRLSCQQWLVLVQGGLFNALVLLIGVRIGGAHIIAGMGTIGAGGSGGKHRRHR